MNLKKGYILQKFMIDAFERKREAGIQLKVRLYNTYTKLLQIQAMAFSVLEHKTGMVLQL